MKKIGEAAFKEGPEKRGRRTRQSDVNGDEEGSEEELEGVEDGENEEDEPEASQPVPTQGQKGKGKGKGKGRALRRVEVHRTCVEEEGSLTRRVGYTTRANAEGRND